MFPDTTALFKNVPRRPRGTSINPRNREEEERRRRAAGRPSPSPLLSGGQEGTFFFFFFLTYRMCSKKRVRAEQSSHGRFAGSLLSGYQATGAVPAHRDAVCTDEQDTVAWRPADRSRAARL